MIEIDNAKEYAELYGEAPRRCEHGFYACYSCRREYRHVTDCHYPGCEDRKARGERFCPKHGGKHAAHWSAGEEE